MSERPKSGEYHRADPAYRRQMQIFLAVTIVVGLAALVALQLWLGRLASSAALGDLSVYQSWLNRLLAGLCLLFAVTAAGFALWMFRFAQASKAERRWPPSSMRTSADVRIRYLTSADSLVTQLRGSAFALALLALLLAGWAAWLLRTS
jgi:flagellar basal body-associated protein FliL